MQNTNFENPSRVSKKGLGTTFVLVCFFMLALLGGQYASETLSTLSLRNEALIAENAKLLTENEENKLEIAILEKEINDLKDEITKFKLMQNSSYKKIVFDQIFEDTDYVLTSSNAYLVDTVYGLDKIQNEISGANFLILKFELQDKRVAGQGISITDRFDFTNPDQQVTSSELVFISDLVSQPQGSATIYVVLAVDKTTSEFNIEISSNSANLGTMNLDFESQNGIMNTGNFYIEDQEIVLK